MAAKLLKQHRSFEGQTCFYEHVSTSTKTNMKFSTFFPREKDKIENCIIWLSGLTCTEENFITKAGAQKYLAGTRTMLICPDTSPRGLNLVGEHDSYDFGSGAGFYVNATTPGYKDHYQMYDYVAKELTQLVTQEFGVTQFSIMGHSMGGHGALVLGLREQSLFKRVSAFSPIVHPSQCAWGQKAFQGYLGSDQSAWKPYDAVELVNQGHRRNDTILIDQGSADEFLETQLLTSHLDESAHKHSQELILHQRAGYDHSYYFISTFIGEHIAFHLAGLKV